MPRLPGLDQASWARNWRPSVECKRSCRVCFWVVVVSCTCLHGLRPCRARTRSKRCLRALSRFLLFFCPFMVFLWSPCSQVDGRPTLLLVPQHVNIQPIFGDDRRLTRATDAWESWSVAHQGRRCFKDAIFGTLATKVGMRALPSMHCCVFHLCFSALLFSFLFLVAYYCSLCQFVCLFVRLFVCLR